MKKRNIYKFPGIKNKLQVNMASLFYTDATKQSTGFLTFFYSRRRELLRSYEYQHGCIPSFEQSQEGMLFASMLY